MVLLQLEEDRGYSLKGGTYVQVNKTKKGWKERVNARAKPYYQRKKGLKWLLYSSSRIPNLRIIDPAL